MSESFVKTKKQSQIGVKWSAMRVWLRESTWLNWTVILFLAGFLAAWSGGVHKKFFYFVILFPFLVSMTRRDLQIIFSSRIIQLLAVLLFYLLISMLWSDSTSFKLVYNNIRYALLIFAFVAMVAWVVYRSPDWPNQLLYVLVPVAFFVLMYSVVAYYGENNFPRARLNNMVFYYDNPIRGSVGFTLVAILSLSNMLIDRHKLITIVSFVGLAVSIAFLVLAQSRGLLLGTAVGMAIQLCCYRHWKSLIVGTLIIIGTVIALETSGWGLTGFIERADSYRITIWSFTIDRIAANPILGEGIITDIRIIGNDGMVFYSPHNVWLMVFLVGGFVGFGLFAMLMAVAGGKALTGVIRKYPYSCLYLSLMASGLIMVSFNSHDLLDRIRPHLWIGLWLPIGMLAGQELGLRSADESSSG